MNAEEPHVLTTAERKILFRTQRNEATEAIVYNRLAAMEKNEENARILQQIAGEEAKHRAYLQMLLGESAPPRRWKVLAYVFLARVCGLSFGLRLMERGEWSAIRTYGGLADAYPGLKRIAGQEEAHEIALVGILDDERLSYMGSIVLGLNDALVELTGALAGFTFALANPRLVAVTGLITGLAASMSMAASGYLAAREEENPKKPPLKSALYTGGAYVLTVILLILPYFFFPSSRVALAVTLGTAFLIIAVFNYYISIARAEPFWRRFLEMAALSAGVAAISFVIGLALNGILPET